MTPAAPPCSPLPTSNQFWQESLHWQPSPEQQEQFQALYAGIMQGNQQMNLTRITDPAEFLEKHLWDSLSGLAPWLAPPEYGPDWQPTHPVKTMIDIGTGAGFPGLAVAIALPTCRVTLLDSTQKKIRFLQALTQAMGLTTVQPWADRAEYLGHQPSHREQYDVALVRAVGATATCAEYALPLVKVGGTVILYRGQWNEQDQHQLCQAAQQLGGHILAVQAWNTPLTQSRRHCVYLQKTTRTDDSFPRPVGIPAKQPLGEDPMTE